jgi:uncharacterized protein DUF4388
MALAGTLRDFSLADILQLIALQRKTGVLTLKGREDTVTMLFEEGQVVGIESEARRLEDRLGHVLIKSGKINAAGLDRVLRAQRETGRRIGNILLDQEAITREDLIRALHLQATQILYRLFRWRDGEYHFKPSPGVEYDRRLVQPLPVDNILLEGMRILDEWPMIEKRIRSFETVYAPSDSSRTVVASAESEDEGVALSLDGTEAAGGAATSPEERVYRLLDGRRSVQDVIDMSDLGEFEACKSLFQLLQSDLIREIEPAARVAVPQADAGAAEGKGRLVATALSLVLVAGAVAGIRLGGTRPQLLPFSPWPEGAVVDTLRRAASRTRLARLDAGVRVHVLERGAAPERLEDLSEHGLVNPPDLVDPWGREYGFVRSRRSFQIRGTDGRGREVADLIINGRLPEAGDAAGVDAPASP